jgi:hypothetical protein
VTNNDYLKEAINLCIDIYNIKKNGKWINHIEITQDFKDYFKIDKKWYVVDIIINNYIKNGKYIIVY